MKCIMSLEQMVYCVAVVWIMWHTQLRGMNAHSLDTRHSRQLIFAMQHTLTGTSFIFGRHYSLMYRTRTSVAHHASGCVTLWVSLLYYDRRPKFHPRCGYAIMYTCARSDWQTLVNSVWYASLWWSARSLPLLIETVSRDQNAGA